MNKLNFVRVFLYINYSRRELSNYHLIPDSPIHFLPNPPKRQWKQNPQQNWESNIWEFHHSQLWCFRVKCAPHNAVWSLKKGNKNLINNKSKMKPFPFFSNGKAFMVLNVFHKSKITPGTAGKTGSLWILPRRNRHKIRHKRRNWAFKQCVIPNNYAFSEYINFISLRCHWKRENYVMSLKSREDLGDGWACKELPLWVPNSFPSESNQPDMIRNSERKLGTVHLKSASFPRITVTRNVWLS